MSSSIGAALAYAAGRRAKPEEQDWRMPGYGPDWEFKILRLSWGRFRSPPFTDRTLAQEAQAGCQLVEKLDDFRLRLGRRVSHRSGDALRQIDPYRTTLGTSALAWWAVASIAGSMVAATVWILARGA